MPSPYIKYIKLPGSSGVYTIRDAEAWDANTSGTLQYQINQLADQIAGGVTFSIVWTQSDYESSTEPTEKLAGIPKDVVVYYNNGASSATGTLTAASTTKGIFYLIYSKTQAGTLDVFDEYVTVDYQNQGTTAYRWEKIGDTQIDLTGIVTDVSVSTTSAAVLGTSSTFTAPSQTVGNKNTFTTDNVLGEDTTFQLTSGAVTHGSLSGHTDSVLGADTTFEVTQPTITVTPTMNYLKATAANGAVSGTTRYLNVSVTDVAIGGDGTANAVTGYGSTTSDSFVKSVSAETNKKLVTTSIPNVTGVGTSSTWSFEMGSGAEAETLIISGNNSTTPTLGTAITAATGATASNGAGDAIVTGVTIGDSAYAITSLGTPTTATVLTGVKVTTQPTAALSKSLLSGTVSYLESVTMDNQPTITLTASTNALVGPGVVTGISSATAAGTAVTASNNDNVTTIISMPASSVSTAITVGTNDKVNAVTGFAGNGLVIPSQAITVSASEVNAVTSVSLSVTKG